MITLERARELLKQAMETQGRDFIYAPRSGSSACFYTVMDFENWKEWEATDSAPLRSDDPRSKSGCLIGVALDLAGYTQHHGLSKSVLKLTSIVMEPAAREYFGVAQRLQDVGRTWGVAYDTAEASLGIPEGWDL